MKIVLLLSLCCTVVVYGQHNYMKKVPATDENYLVNLQRKYSNELYCLKRLDAVLKSKWTMDLEKISIKDLDSVMPEWEFKSPSKPMYHIVEQEWLLESGSTAKQIESCIRGLVPDIVPLMNQDEINCVNSIFAFHIEEEYVHEDIFKMSLKNKAREQLPFRRFISFNQFVDLMFQSRTPDALGSLERTVYEHAESYLTTEEERDDQTYIMEQECEWKNSMALRKASNVEARLKEFESQVRDSVNQQLANLVLQKWNLNSTLPRDKYLAWLQAREDMTSQINAEVQRLRTQKKDAQWLCEHATKFAYKLSGEQGDILRIGEDKEKLFDRPVELQILDVAKKARGIEKVMEKSNDFRQPVLKILTEKFENGAMCLSAFTHLIQNHRLFDIALGFVDDEYNYPEFYCKDKNLNLGLIATRFCKCIGSFCVHHALAALFAEEYNLVQGPDGIYRVVLSGVKSRKKVQAWDNRD